MRTLVLLLVALALSSRAYGEVRRGLFLEVDVGGGVMIGGRNTNSFGEADPDIGVCRVRADQKAPFPKKVVSNLQPFGAVVVGYDLFSSDVFALAGGIRFSLSHANGAGRVSEEELTRLYDDPSCLETFGTQSADYAVYEAGGLLEASFMLSDRFALVVEATGSLAVVDPHPALTASDPEAGRAVLGPAIGGALAAQYFTLLAGFSIGLDLRFEMILLSGSAIPAAQIAIPIRYTF